MQELRSYMVSFMKPDFIDVIILRWDPQDDKFKTLKICETSWILREKLVVVVVGDAFFNETGLTDGQVIQLIKEAIVHQIPENLEVSKRLWATVRGED